MGFAVAEISGRRTDQLGDLMAVLKFGAVNLDDARGSPKSDSAMASTTRVLPEPVGPRNRRLPTGRARSVQSGQKHLVDFSDFFDSRILADDFPPQGGFEVQRIGAAPGRIKSSIKAGPHNFPASSSRGRPHNKEA